MLRKGHWDTLNLKVLIEKKDKKSRAKSDVKSEFDVSFKC